jgi:hypothetical protein
VDLGKGCKVGEVYQKVFNIESNCPINFEYEIKEQCLSVEWGVQKLIEDSHNSMTKVIIGTAGTVVAGVLSVLVVLLTKMN